MSDKPWLPTMKSWMTDQAEPEPSEAMREVKGWMRSRPDHRLFIGGSSYEAPPGGGINDLQLTADWGTTYKIDEAGNLVAVESYGEEPKV